MKKNRKTRAFGVSIVFLMTVALLIPVLSGLFSGAKAEGKTVTVVVDPGHGGEDGGAVGDDGTLEKDLNLVISLRLKEKLEQAGYTVVMTRTTDDDTDGLNGLHKKQDLQARVEIAEKADADLFVSVHINASTSSRDQGFQVWYGMNAAAGEDLANKIVSRVEQAEICTRIRIVRQVPEELYIFRSLHIPNVLVECGFISNPQDRHLLQQQEFREALTDAICAGICDHIAERNSAVT